MSAARHPGDDELLDGHRDGYQRHTEWVRARVTVVVFANSPSTVIGTFTSYTTVDVTGPLTSGVPKAVNMEFPGQQTAFTFGGVAGHHFTVAVSNAKLSANGSPGGTMSMQVLGVGGASLGTTNFSTVPRRISMLYRVGPGRATVVVFANSPIHGHRDLHLEHPHPDDQHHRRVPVGAEHSSCWPSLRRSCDAESTGLPRARTARRAAPLLMLRKDMSKDVEILVLRHQWSPLHRQVGRPHLDAVARGVMCILTRMTASNARHRQV